MCQSVIDWNAWPARSSRSSDKCFPTSWKPIGAQLPFPASNCNIYGFTYSAELKRFFLIHNDCSGNILSDAIYSAEFDYETN